MVRWHQILNTFKNWERYLGLCSIIIIQLQIRPNFNIVARVFIWWMHGNITSFSRRSHKKVAGDIAKREKKVLVIGSGYVSSPLIEYLTRDKNIFITIGQFTSVHLRCNYLVCFVALPYSLLIPQRQLLKRRPTCWLASMLILIPQLLTLSRILACWLSWFPMQMWSSGCLFCS